MTANLEIVMVLIQLLLPMVHGVTEDFNQSWWRKYAATLAQRFRQDVIHVRALRIEILETEERR